MFALRPAAGLRKTSLAILVAALAAAWFAPLSAQESDGPLSDEEINRRAEESLAGDAADEDALVPLPVVPQETGEQLNWLELVLKQGGIFMIPIGLISLLVVACGVERFIGLRRRKVVPPGLIEELGQLATRPGGLDPRAAYQACQHYPSAAASVVKAALLKVGRPHPEVEHAVALAGEREATRLYANVRHLQLGISVAPLLGLLGTVQGMIVAFFTNVHLEVGQNRAAALSEGIYTALVTTLAGLCVAIPAAILAHYFEGRIQRLFAEIDELLLNMLPQLERYEGKLRVRRDRDLAAGESDAPARRPRETANEPAHARAAEESKTA